MSWLNYARIGYMAAYSAVAVNTPTQIEFVDGVFTLSIVGSGFTAGGERLPTGGTVTSLTIYDSSRSAYVAYGSADAPLGIPFDDLRAGFIRITTVYTNLTGPPPRAYEDVLAGGPDTVLGSAGGDFLQGGGGNDVLIGLDGADTLVGDVGDDRLEGGAGVDTAQYLGLTGVHVSLLLQGAPQDVGGGSIQYGVVGGGGLDTLISIENLTGSVQNDVLTGDAGGNRLDGHLGDDVLIGRGGGDSIIGGMGIDTAVYVGVRRSATISRANSAYLVTDGEGGTDVVQQVERLRFIDGFAGIDAIDTPAVVYRLYVAALGRTADAPGLSSWVKAIDTKSADIRAVADGFLLSNEFQARYGASTSNVEFIGLLYKNVLGRAPDADGLNNWLGALGGGRTRAEVLIGFSDSQENITKTQAALQQGVWVGDPNAGIAARFYDTVFSRLPDASGLDTWTKALNAGASLQSVANGFVASIEFQTTYGALNDNQFVELMYRNVLHRPSDTGRQTWLELLNSGGSRAQVVVGFSESAEHIRLTAPHIDDGVWVA